MAAVKLAHEAGGTNTDDEDIPEAGPFADRDGRRRAGTDSRPPRRAHALNAGMARLFIGAGRSAGVRPQDLVGAITGETSLGGREIGNIQIADRFSLVEVPDGAADDIVAALRRTTIKGRKAQVRRAREDR
jgi:ATP-dependent RNA helicase DeaD